jgi:hypothetical protein
MARQKEKVIGKTLTVMTLVQKAPGSIRGRGQIIVNQDHYYQYKN